MVHDHPCHRPRPRDLRDYSAVYAAVLIRVRRMTFALGLFIGANMTFLLFVLAEAAREN